MPLKARAAGVLLVFVGLHHTRAQIVELIVATQPLLTAPFPSRWERSLERLRSPAEVGG